MKGTELTRQKASRPPASTVQDGAKVLWQFYFAFVGLRR